jgi:proteasome activator subunit 3 (PA28 gamma)
LNIPRIEDGNNFGVSIQEETVSELGRSEDAGFAVLETMTKYFVTRAKLVSRVVKYPDIEDYRQSVIELDEKEYINLRLCCLDLRNNYAILYDMISKNLEKIKTPRSSNHMATML